MCQGQGVFNLCNENATVAAGWHMAWIVLQQNACRALREVIWNTRKEVVGITLSCVIGI
jgi:preprotein translocase subunit SecE